jgi:tRNA(fMet)-specific endonuclease VapC
LTAVSLLPVVLDTSVVSIIYNQDPRAPFYERHLEGLRTFVSFQTLEEIYIWPRRNQWGERRRNELMLHMDQYEVIWPDPALVHISAQLRAEREKAGRRLNTADAWIAATALYMNCSLASHDGDFTGIPGLNLIRHPSA